MAQVNAGFETGYPVCLVHRLLHQNCELPVFKINHRACFLVGTMLLSITCLCCAATGLLLVLDRTMGGASAETIAADLRELLAAAQDAHGQVEAFWNELAAGRGAACGESGVALPRLHVLNPDDANKSPRLTEAAAHVNRAIDRIAWALVVWDAACAEGDSPAARTSEAFGYLDAARQSLDAAGELLGVPPE
jgi:hypothetical protein